MRHYCARQRISDGRFEFVCGDMALGYCAPPITRADFERIGWVDCGQELAQIELHKAKYHSDGHATKAEAEACYHEYLLDNQLSLNHLDSGQQRKCRVCSNWTSHYAILGYSQILSLCDEHRNRETVAKITTPSSDFWIS